MCLCHRLCFLCLILVLLVACGNDESQLESTSTIHNPELVKPSNEAKHGSAPADLNKLKPVLRFAITPWQKGKDLRELHENYRPMLSYLSEACGYRFEIICGRTYQETIDLISEGKVQLANLSPVPYVMSKRRNPDLNILVVEKSWNKARTQQTDSYIGMIVCKKDAPYKSIKDLKGCRFGFVKRESSSGYRYPNAMLIERGIQYKEFFGKTYFLGSHPRVTDAVAAGSIDAGATWDYNLLLAQQKNGDVYKILYQTPPIPNLCVVAHPSVDINLQQQLKELLLNIDPSKLERTTADSFTERDDSFYDVVRTVVAVEEQEQNGN